jgi:hypothetical protein
LEFFALGDSAVNLLVGIGDKDRRVEALHKRPQILEGTPLLALKLLVIVWSFRFLLLKLILRVSMDGKL